MSVFVVLDHCESAAIFCVIFDTMIHSVYLECPANYQGGDTMLWKFCHSYTDRFSLISSSRYSVLTSSSPFLRSWLRQKCYGEYLELWSLCLGFLWVSLSWLYLFPRPDDPKSFKLEYLRVLWSPCFTLSVNPLNLLHISTIDPIDCYWSYSHR